jgi:hypothetical protein
VLHLAFWTVVDAGVTLAGIGEEKIIDALDRDPLDCRVTVVDYSGACGSPRGGAMVASYSWDFTY